MPELPQPSDRAAIERSFEGYRAALAMMTVPELMELAAKQGALLEEQRRNLISGALSASDLSQIDSPVSHSTPTEFPSRPARDPRALPSPSRLPFPSARRSRSASPDGARLAGKLASRSRRSR
jgi:hypothetical protein